jgi:hypothetical protein
MRRPIPRGITRQLQEVRPPSFAEGAVAAMVVVELEVGELEVALVASAAVTPARPRPVPVCRHLLLLRRHLLLRPLRRCHRARQAVRLLRFPLRRALELQAPGPQAPGI